MALSLTLFIVDLFLLLAGSLFAGEAASRLGQPALVGQLLVGLLLGPTVFGSFLGLGSFPAGFASIQILATVFVLFIAGLEVVPEEILGIGLRGVGAGILAFLGPFALLLGVARLALPTMGLYPLLFVSLTLSITALPVMGLMLVEFRLTGTRMGRFLISTALVNELSAVTLFAILIGVQATPAAGWVAVGRALASLAGFLGVMFGIYFLLRQVSRGRRWGRLRETFAREWRSPQGGFALLMVLVIGASLFAQYLGLTYAVGAFYAGLLVTRETAGVDQHRTLSAVFDTISWGFFVPLFFAFVGLQMDLRLLGSPAYLLAFAVLFGVGISGKWLVGYALGRRNGWTDPDASAIGYLLASRGAVELAMAVIVLDAGVINLSLFALIAGIGLLTTIVAPIGALASWRSTPESATELYHRLPVLERQARSLRPPATRWGDLREWHQFSAERPPLPDPPKSPSRAEARVPPPPSRPPLPPDPPGEA